MEPRQKIYREMQRDLSLVAFSIVGFAFSLVVILKLIRESSVFISFYLYM